LRKRAWISTTLLVLGSFFVSLEFVSISPRAEFWETSRTAPGSDRATTFDAAAIPPSTVANGLRRVPADRPDERTETHEPNDPQDARTGRGLDLASRDVIRETLLAAIERERTSHPLFVTPGLVDRVATDRRIRIVFENPPGRAQERALALLEGPSGLAEVDSVRVFPLLAFGAARVGPQALLQLIQAPSTGRIELDALHRPSLEETIPIIRADLAHLDGHDGDGFAIAILDTGVDATHPMYADRLIEEACFSTENDCPNGLSEMFGVGAAIPCPMAGCGHGTRIAGIALGEEPGGSLVGVAPNADLIAIQIFSNVAGAPAAFSSDILAGLQHVLALSALYPIASANLSLGGSPFTTQASCDQAVASQRNAVALLRAANVLTIAAAGNEFFTNALTTPACISNVIGVGATSDADVVSTFSNSAPFLRLLAPGESVESSRLGGGTSVASGTSMASAHVAGAIAAIREAVPAATADEIDNALALSGVPVTDARNGVTTPRIRVEDAITLLEASGGGGSTPAATASSGGGGGGGCGLIGIELFLALGIVRLGRRTKRIGPRKAEVVAPAA
jgi:subtilisin